MNENTKLNREEFIEKLTSNGKIVPRRCTEAYLLKNDLFEHFINLLKENQIPADDLSLSFDFLIHQKRCSICGTRIIHQYTFCHEHKDESKKSKPAHNRKFDRIDINQLIEMRKTMSIKDIALSLGNDYLTIKKALEMNEAFQPKRKRKKDYSDLFDSFQKKLSEYPNITRHEMSKVLNLSDQAISSIEESLNVKLSSRYQYIDERVSSISYFQEAVQSLNCHEISVELNCSPSLALKQLSKFQIPTPAVKRSKQEMVIVDFLSNQGFEATLNSRKIIPPKEIDIFIPEKNLAIEVNGVYWHSEVSGGRDRKYHIDKMMRSREAGVELIQIYDIEIINSEEKIFSLLRSKLGITPTKIYARKCRVSDEICKESEKLFFTENHRQGYAASQFRVGLFDQDDELVSLMSFRKPRYNKNVDWELLRFASKLNTQVVGGASRLFSKRPSGSVVSYSDNRFGTGGFYLNLGFEFMTIGNPSYHYTKNHVDLFHRSSFMKKDLANRLDIFSSELSEWENMKANGWDRIWDCGNSTWAISRSKLM
jgi:hypothetical protein